jgi:hypothetical protein
MAAGALLGGYLGGSLVRFADRTVVRLGIVTLGIAVAAYYFWRIYGGGIDLLEAIEQQINDNLRWRKMFWLFST